MVAALAICRVVACCNLHAGVSAEYIQYLHDETNQTRPEPILSIPSAGAMQEDGVKGWEL